MPALFILCKTGPLLRLFVKHVNKGPSFINGTKIKICISKYYRYVCGTTLLFHGVSHVQDEGPVFQKMFEGCSYGESFQSTCIIGPIVDIFCNLWKRDPLLLQFINHVDEGLVFMKNTF